MRYWEIKGLFIESLEILKNICPMALYEMLISVKEYRPYYEYKIAFNGRSSKCLHEGMT